MFWLAGTEIEKGSSHWNWNFEQNFYANFYEKKKTLFHCLRTLIVKVCAKLYCWNWNIWYFICVFGQNWKKENIFRQQNWRAYILFLKQRQEREERKYQKYGLSPVRFCGGNSCNTCVCFPLFHPNIVSNKPGKHITKPQSSEWNEANTNVWSL